MFYMHGLLGLTVYCIPTEFRHGFLLAPTSSVWKRKGYYQITHDLDSHLAFHRFVDLN